MRLRVELPADFIREGESEIDALWRWIEQGGALKEVRGTEGRCDSDQGSAAVVNQEGTDD